MISYKLRDYIKPMVNWDNVKSRTEMIIREMLYDDPRDVLNKYGYEELRGIYLTYIHRFDKRNKAFWKVFLDISDDEYERAIRENFREANKVWDY